MSWQLALGLFFVVTTVLALFQRSYSQKHTLPESFPPALSYLLGVMPAGIIVGLAVHHHVTWSWWLGLLLISEGIFIGLYNWLSFRAIRRLPLARFQLIYQVYELVVIVLGWSVLKEGLNFFQVIGGLFILSAALLAIRAPDKNRQQLSKAIKGTGIGLAVASALVMGCGLVIEKAALRHMDSGAYFIFGYATQSLALLVLSAKDITKQTLRAITLVDYKKSFTMGLLSAMTGFTYIIAIVKSDNISLITALSAFALPLAILGGYVILRERDNLKSLLGALGLGVVGLIVSALR